MSLRERFHRFTFSKGFVLVLSIIVALGLGFGSALFSNSNWVWIISGIIGFALIWLLFGLFIFLILTDSTAKGEEL